VSNEEQALTIENIDAESLTLHIKLKDGFQIALGRQISDELLEAILDELREIKALLGDAFPRTSVQARKVRVGTTVQEPLSADDMNSIEDDINIDWWFHTYGEDPHPAKYMDRQGLGYNEAELSYLSASLKDRAQNGEKVSQGTHVFQYVGKKYCKAEKNTVSCFACLPV